MVTLIPAGMSKNQLILVGGKPGIQKYAAINNLSHC